MQLSTRFSDRSLRHILPSYCSPLDRAQEVAPLGKKNALLTIVHALDIRFTWQTVWFLFH